VREKLTVELRLFSLTQPGVVSKTERGKLRGDMNEQK